MKEKNVAHSILTLENQMKTTVIFNRDVIVVERAKHYWRLRITLRHSGLAKLYGRFFPLRNYHDYIIDGTGLEILMRFYYSSAIVEDMIRDLCNQHKLSFYEGRTLIVEYLGRLMRSGIAVLEVPDGGKTEEVSRK